MIKCRHYKNFTNEHFKNYLCKELTNNTELDYNSFKEIVLNILSFEAHLIKNGPGK